MFILQNARHGPSNFSVHNPLLLAECFYKAPQLRRFERRSRRRHGYRFFGLILNGCVRPLTSRALIVSKDFHKLTELGACFGVWTLVSSTASIAVGSGETNVCSTLPSFSKRARIDHSTKSLRAQRETCPVHKACSSSPSRETNAADIQTHYRPALR